MSCILLDVIGDGFLIVLNFLLDRRLKEFCWIKLTPILIASWEVLADEVTGYGSEGYRAITPWRGKCIIEAVVFSPLGASHILLEFMLAPGADVRPN
jgi:hypothetical protein